MQDRLERKWPGWTRGLAAALVALGLASCRVGAPFRADALTEPFPDGALDRGADRSASVDGGNPCDLIAQNCTDHTQYCYPVDGVPGATQCKLPGTGTVTTGCASQTDCDRFLACEVVPETGGMQMCVTICNPAAITTGCPPKAPCHLIAGYQAGYCVP